MQQRATLRWSLARQWSVGDCGQIATRTNDSAYRASVGAELSRAAPEARHKRTAFRSSVRSFVRTKGSGDGGTGPGLIRRTHLCVRSYSAHLEVLPCPETSAPAVVDSLAINPAATAAAVVVGDATAARAGS